MGIFETVIEKLALLAFCVLIIFLAFTLIICPFIDCRLPVFEKCEQKQTILQ